MWFLTRLFHNRKLRQEIESSVELIEELDEIIEELKAESARQDEEISILESQLKDIERSNIVHKTSTGKSVIPVSITGELDLDEFRAISFNDKYEVNAVGVVRNIKTKRIIKPYFSDAFGSPTNYYIHYDHHLFSINSTASKLVPDAFDLDIKNNFYVFTQDVVDYVQDQYENQYAYNELKNNRNK